MYSILITENDEVQNATEMPGSVLDEPDQEHRAAQTAEQGVTHLFNDAWDTRLSNILKTGNRQELDGLMKEVSAELKNRNAGPAAGRICLIEMYAVVLRVFRNISGSKKFLSGDMIFREEILRLAPVKQWQWLTGLCHNVIDVIHHRLKTSARVLVEKGYEYLRANYADPNISLKTVSNLLHISASYLSAIFKKETGWSFTDALTKIRMEAARDLLLTTKHKIFEIAALIGYSDQHYFS